MTRTADHEHWSRVFNEWIAWARAPNHDAFWAYRDLLTAFIGRGAGEALDVGCGEGRVSRELKACGYRVIASDPVCELVDAAKEARSADGYAVASGIDLPFEDARFDLVMAYNVLMDIEDVPAILKRDQTRPATRRNAGDLDRASVFGSRALRHYGANFSLCHPRHLLWPEAV